MTKMLEEFFNVDPEPENTPVKTKEEILSEVEQVYNAFTASEKIDAALPMIRGLNEHDVEMDNISAHALKTYSDLCQLGMNVPDMHAGKIFEDAALMLKIALDASDAKVTRKLKIIDLQIKKAKLDKLDPDREQDSTKDSFDRNEILTYITESKEK